MVYGKAVLSQNHSIQHGVCKVDLSKDMKESIRCQTGLMPANGKVVAYKQIKNNRSSFHDKTFFYPETGIVEAENPDESHHSCTSGLHFSNANYWNLEEDPYDSLTIVAEILLEDIITVQNGKIRCRKANVIG